MATNIWHWLKVQSRLFINYIFAKKCILISFWIFKYCFNYSFTHYYCAIFYSLDAGFRQFHPGVKQFGFRSGPTFCLIWVRTVSKGHQNVWLDLHSNCLQRLSADNKSGQRVKYKKKLVDTTFWLKPWLKLISFGKNIFHLA